MKAAEKQRRISGARSRITVLDERVERHERAAVEARQERAAAQRDLAFWEGAPVDGEPTEGDAGAACPECAAGKHDNCDGRSWDLVADKSVPCPCAAAEHAPDREVSS